MLSPPVSCDRQKSHAWTGRTLRRIGGMAPGQLGKRTTGRRVRSARAPEYTFERLFASGPHREIQIRFPERRIAREPRSANVLASAAKKAPRQFRDRSHALAQDSGNTGPGP